MSKTDYEEYVDVQVDALIKKLEMFKIYERKFKSLDGILKDLEVRKKNFQIQNLHHLNKGWIQRKIRTLQMMFL